MFAETRRFMLPVVASLLLFSVGRAEEPQPFPAGVYYITINAREVPAMLLPMSDEHSSPSTC
jgi:hypothetical protein